MEALTYEPSPATVITPFKNGDQERMIHCNTELQEGELERLQLLQLEARAQSAEFFPSVTSMATRFLSRARNDQKKAFRLMMETQQWREQYFRDGPVTDVAIEEDSRHGIVYFTGRDSKLRPAIVVRAKRIPQQWYKEKRVDKLLRLIIFCMEYFLRYLVVPGRVENLSVITDLQGLGLAQVPLSALNEVHKVLGVHYIGRVSKFYVCNVSPSLYAIAGMAKAMLTDRQKHKIMVLNNPSELRNDFSLHQLEDDLGGTRQNIEIGTSFLPFPIVAGPFEAGFDGGPNVEAVPNAHELLTTEGAIGRLWNPKMSREVNLILELPQVAPFALGPPALPNVVSSPSGDTTEAIANADEDEDDNGNGLGDFAHCRNVGDEDPRHSCSSSRSALCLTAARSMHDGFGFRWPRAACRFDLFSCCQTDVSVSDSAPLCMERRRASVCMPV
jgi:hypothetical protein